MLKEVILSNLLLVALIADFIALLLLKALYEAHQSIKAVPYNSATEPASKILFGTSILVAFTALAFTIYAALVTPL